ncbi:MAG: YceI family protein [Pseudobdellovibrionaceae bacterium]
MRKTLTAISALTFLIATTAFAAVYKIDPAHTNVGFSVKHLVVSTVRGNFNKFEGSFDFDEKKNEVSKIDVKVDPASINTNNKKRDEHLVSPDFFDAKKNPELRFKSDKSVIVKQDQTVKITGDLTMRGVTKPVTMDLTYGGMVTDAMGTEKVGFSLRGKINRKDWGINWNKALDKGGVTVSDEVMIEIDGEGNKEKAAK